jgi:putative transposase
MIDILALLQCLAPCVTPTTLRQWSRIIYALLAMSGRVTMLGISRWAGKGGSYRTVQRFFYTVIPWAMVFWSFFRQHIFDPSDVYLLAGDECVVPKAGKRTYGLDRFFSSLYAKPVPGIAFFALSLISTRQRRSFPIMMEQMVRAPAEKATAKAQAKDQKQQQKGAKKHPVGRPKGSKNKDKTQVVLTSELRLIKTMVQKLLLLLNGLFGLTYLVLDGHFGHNNALQMTRQCGLHLISKLRCDAALYFPYDGPYGGRGPRRKYGDKIDYDNIPDRYLRQTTVEGDIRTDVYQAQMLHKEFAQLLNVVVIVKSNLKTQARAHVVLFSSDLHLPYDQLIDYYRLRFQIEFNFRDAKQYWGLDDFMNIKETAVTNAANLSLFMVNVAHHLLADFRQHNPHCGVLDLKAYFRGHKYVTETLKCLPQMPEPIFLAQIFDHVTRLGSIHASKSVLIAP